jgi:hypothetical protein
MKGEKSVFFLSQDSMMRGFSGLQHACPPETKKIRIAKGSHFPPISYQRVSEVDGNGKKTSKVSAAEIAADFLAAEILSI